MKKNPSLDSIIPSAESTSPIYNERSLHMGKEVRVIIN
jgi:hypothetical protein